MWLVDVARWPPFVPLAWVCLAARPCRVHRLLCRLVSVFTDRWLLYAIRFEMSSQIGTLIRPKSEANMAIIKRRDAETQRMIMVPRRLCASAFDVLLV